MCVKLTLTLFYKYFVRYEFVHSPVRVTIQTPLL